MPKQRDTFNDINITPLTDIFLVLLIIMMVIAPLLDQQGLNLAVPNNVEVEELKDNKLISVTVSNDDKYYIEDQEIAANELESVIKDKSKELPEGLLIMAEPDASHGAVVKLMDNARNAGVTNISISES